MTTATCTRILGQEMMQMQQLAYLFAYLLHEAESFLRN